MMNKEERARIYKYIELNNQLLIRSLASNDLHHAAQAIQNTYDWQSELGMPPEAPLTGIVNLKLRVDSLLDKMTNEHALYNYVIKSGEDQKNSKVTKRDF